MIKKFKEYKENSNNQLSIEELEDQLLRLTEVYGCDILYFFVSDHNLYSFLSPPFITKRTKQALLDDDKIYLIRIWKDNGDKLQEITHELDQIKNRIKSQYNYNVILGLTYNIKHHSKLSFTTYLGHFATDVGDYSEEGIIDYSMIIEKD
jgi:hypothetical protein